MRLAVLGDAALVDRHQSRREGLAGAAQAGLLGRQLLAGGVELAAQLGGALLAFGEQAGEAILLGLRLRRFAFGDRELFAAGAQPGGDRPGFVAGADQLRFEGAGVGGPGPRREPENERQQRSEQRHGGAEGDKVLSGASWHHETSEASVGPPGPSPAHPNCIKFSTCRVVRILMQLRMVGDRSAGC